MTAPARAVPAWRPRHDGTHLRFSHASILLVMLFAFCLLVLVFGLVRSAGAADVAPEVILTFMANLLVAVVVLGVDCVRRPFSLLQVESMFVIIFFCVAPLSQYLEGYSCWGYPLSEDDYLRTNLLILLWQAIFCSSVSLSSRAKVSEQGGAHSVAEDGAAEPQRFLHDGLPSVSRGAVALCLFLSAVCTATLVYLVGFGNLFARSTYSLGLGQTASLVLDKVLRATPVFAFVFAWLRNRQSGDGQLMLACALVMLLIADFPTGMARYMMAVIYLGLLLLCVPAFTRNRGLFAVFFLLIFLIVFPASNVFRREEFDVFLLLNAIVEAMGNITQGGFLNADYDAYSMFSRCFDYVQDLGVTYGWQLLTAALFFVPRAVWPGKAYGSGQTIAEAQGQNFTNLSCPLPAEGLINFGLVGLVVFAIVAGRVVRWYDSRSWSGSHGANLFYPFACVFVFFVMRGDMLSSTAYLVGFAVVYAVLEWAVRRVGSVRNPVGKPARRYS